MDFLKLKVPYSLTRPTLNDKKIKLILWTLPLVNNLYSEKLPVWWALEPGM